MVSISRGAHWPGNLAEVHRGQDPSGGSHRQDKTPIIYLPNVSRQTLAGRG